MSDPIALITGGSRGIGLCTAEALGRRGHTIVITARGSSALDEAVDRVRAAGAPRVVRVAADLRDPNAPGAVLEAVSREVGAPTVLVNNAGTAPTGKFENTDDEMLDEVFDLHVRTPFRFLRALLPGFRRDDHGCVVQIASTAGLRGFPFTSAYTAAKHAMVGMTRSLAAELRGTRIGCYALCPGFVDTEITRAAAANIAARGKQTPDDAMVAMAQLNRIGRMHRPEEIAAAVVRLCTDRPDGTVLDLDAEPPVFV